MKFDLFINENVCIKVESMPLVLFQQKKSFISEGF
ncbi:hypothetical protein FLAN108750_13385 [Flavobacterium antarcticum]